MESNDDNNKFKLVRYNYEDVSDETIEKMLHFEKGYPRMTSRDNPEDSERSRDYFYLKCDGFIDMRYRKSLRDEAIHVMWYLSTSGKSLLNSKRFTSYKRNKSIEKLLDS